tara:strand:- start:106 stop:405 length:300 start_codon:yes stop_codon:yes gene_type:complete
MPDPDKVQALVDHIRALEEESLEDLRKRYYGDSSHPVHDTLEKVVLGRDPDEEVRKLRDQQRPGEDAALFRVNAGQTYRDAVRDASRQASDAYKIPGNR